MDWAGRRVGKGTPKRHTDLQTSQETYRLADVTGDVLVVLDAETLDRLHLRLQVVVAVRLQRLHHHLHLPRHHRKFAHRRALVVHCRQPHGVKVVDVVAAHVLGEFVRLVQLVRRRAVVVVLDRVQVLRFRRPTEIANEISIKTRAATFTSYLYTTHRLHQATTLLLLGELISHVNITAAL